MHYVTCSSRFERKTKIVPQNGSCRSIVCTVAASPSAPRRKSTGRVLGASNFTYAEASWTQALADWIGAHTRAFEAIGGVPSLLVPDNTKVAVIKACLYEPQVNRTYAEMAAHYDTAILPARPRRPRDKAKVEAAVLIVERWLLGRLRHRRFYSLTELNAAIGELLRQLNEERPLRRLGVTRRMLLEELDRPYLRRCPASPTPLPNGGYAASASTTTSRSRGISIAFLIVTRAARSRCA